MKCIMMGKLIFPVLFSIITLGLVVPLHGWADTETQPLVIKKITERIFAPHGFDSNDNTQIVLDGVLKNSCYKAGPVKAIVNENTKVIRVRDSVYFYRAKWCAQTMSRYAHTIDLGIVAPGRYSIVSEGQDEKVEPKAALTIIQTTSAAPDDALYAPVSEATVDYDSRTGNPPELTLRGNFFSTCMKLKDVRVHYSEGNTIEILPLAEMSENNCQRIETPFIATVKLLQAPRGRTLVHVRSLNGRSLNQVYSF